MSWPARLIRCSSPALLGVALLALVGCAGTGRVYLAALDFQAIDPPAGAPPRFLEINMNHCYWWTDEAGRVCVAMDSERALLLGSDWRMRFQLSLTLDQPPAGRARDYRVTNRQCRAVARFGPAQSRWVSRSGVVALYREGPDRFRGSFRMDVAREVQQLLGGWGRASRFLMMGTFTSVPNEAQGRRIAAAATALDEPAEPPESQPVP
jgi:hypothetical protein